MEAKKENQLYIEKIKKIEKKSDLIILYNEIKKNTFM
jgi:hypothetical protein